VAVVCALCSVECFNISLQVVDVGGMEAMVVAEKITVLE
jgi:hypothetical protein